MDTVNRLFLGGPEHGKMHAIDPKVTAYAVVESVNDFLWVTDPKDAILPTFKTHYYRPVKLYEHGGGYGIITYLTVMLHEGTHPDDAPKLYYDALGASSHQFMAHHGKFMAHHGIPADVPMNYKQVYEGAYDTPSDPNLDRLYQLVPGVNSVHQVSCPNCLQLSSTVSGMIVHLNDHHEASFEEIADWLDTLDIDLSVKA